MSDGAKRLPADPEPLLAALAANEISDEQLDELHALLKASSPATHELAERIRDTLMIREWLRAESDERFAQETAKLIARLQQGSGRAFVSDTMQRVRSAASKGRRRATGAQSSAGQSGLYAVRRRQGKRNAWAPIGILLMGTLTAACILAVVSLGLIGLRDTKSTTASLTQQPAELEVDAATDARRGTAGPLEAGEQLRPGETVTTGPTGRTLLRYRDGTVLGLGSGGELLLLPGQTPANPTAPSKQLLLRAGDLTATVSPQPTGQPVVLLTPHATLSVIGTRFAVQVMDSQTRLEVTEGAVRMERGEDHLLVEKGTIAVADGNGLRSVGPDPARRYEDLMASLSVAETCGDGEWSVRLSKEGPVLRQTHAACTSATLQLAPPKWKTGYLTGQCRVVWPATGKDSRITLRLLVRSPSSPEQVENHPIPYWTSMSRELSESWFNLNVRFRLTRDGRLFTEILPCWYEDLPPSLGRIGALGHESSDPRVPSVAPLQNVDRFGLAIECRNAVAEFRRLRFCVEPDVPELHPERILFEKIAAQKGSGMDTGKATASPNGTWHLSQTDAGLQILRNDNSKDPSSLNLGVLPHRRVLLSGQIIALPPERTDEIPAKLTNEGTRVPSGKQRLAFNSLRLSGNRRHPDSPCFLAVPASDPTGRKATVMHFHANNGEAFGIPKTGTSYHFVAFLDLDCRGKQSQGHSYWIEGKTTQPFWCIPSRERWPASIQEPFTLQLYSKGQRILWRNLKIVPY